MTSPREAALLAEIRAVPDDDALRLVFADVLSERGDPWGELIVAGCELLRNPALHGLRRLDLSNQPLGHAAVVALANAKLDSLEWLDLSNCRLDPESAYVLAKSPTLPRRLSLRLQANARGPDSVTEPLLERFNDVRF